MQQGKFISFEGIEGVGKTTNIKFAKQFLEQQGIEVVLTREPGGTELAEKLRTLLLDRDSEELDPKTELLLLYSGRVQHIKHVIKPALAKGKWVLSDRFNDATYAYQGGGRKVDLRLIDELDSWCLQGFAPDLVILLDAEVKVGLERIQVRHKLDRFEQEKEEFFTRVRDLYLTRAKNNPDKVKLIDTQVSLEQVTQKIKDTLREVL